MYDQVSARSEAQRLVDSDWWCNLRHFVEPPTVCLWIVYCTHIISHQHLEELWQQLLDMIHQQHFSCVLPMQLSVLYTQRVTALATEPRA